MRNSLNYLKLWQQKRNELPVNDSAQADWMQMQSLLDLHLPSVPHHNVPQGDKVFKASKVIKAAKGFKMLLVLASTTAAIFTSVYIYKHVHKTKQNHPNNRLKKQVFDITADSLQTIDSLNRADSVAYKVNSRSPSKSTLANEDSSTNNNAPDSGLTGKNVLANNRAIVNANNAAISIPNKNSGLPVIIKSGKNQGAITLPNSPSRVVNQPKGQRHIVNNSRALNTNNNGKQGLGGITPTGYQNGQIQSNNYHPLVLSANFQRSQYLASGIDSIQTDINNYFSQPAINSILYSNAKQKDVTLKRISATVNDIVGKISKSSAGLIKLQADQKPKNGKQEKATKAKVSSPFNFDWGLLTGVNTSGSFTPKKQNSNFYGSLPIDLNLGLYGIYNFNDKWAINVQARGLSPQNIGGSYSHVNGAKADSGEVDSGKTIRVTDSRKAYFVSIPIHLAYKLNNYLSIKGGPVINIPVKQLAGATSITPLAVKKDTPYYTSVSNQLKNTRYIPSVNLGLSAGVSLQYNRLSFEATYLKSISGYKVTSDFGSYKSYPGTVQLTIGFQLNKPKNK